jgi:hypothetical protein
MFSTLLRNKIAWLLFFIYLSIALWWLKINTFGLISDYEVYIFNWSYGFIPFVGAMYGIFYSSKYWGGWNSLLGRGIIYICLGLLGQWLGLQIWTYYNLIARVEVPYPSLADIGYFALIPFYSMAGYSLAKAAGGKFSLRTPRGQMAVLIIPLLMLTAAYMLFVRDIGFDFTTPLKTFLDYGYPLGEIIPVCFALFIISIAKNLDGGSMRSRVLYLAFAFTFQFITEYLFLYAVSSETYINGGYNDLLYATSYFIMSLGVVSFKQHED